MVSNKNEASVKFSDGDEWFLRIITISERLNQLWTVGVLCQIVGSAVKSGMQTIAFDFSIVGTT